MAGVGGRRRRASVRDKRERLKDGGGSSSARVCVQKGVLDNSFQSSDTSVRSEREP